MREWQVEQAEALVHSPFYLLLLPLQLSRSKIVLLVEAASLPKVPYFSQGVRQRVRASEVSCSQVFGQFLIRQTAARSDYCTLDNSISVSRLASSL